MFRFQEPYHLLAWILVPVFLGLFFGMLYLRKKDIERLGDADIIAQLMPQYSKSKHWIKIVLILVAVVLLGLAYANPQWGTKRETVQRKSSDVFIALDISNSMYATDIAPSRLERAKKFTRKLIDKLSGERIGLIVFAGNAYIHMPLTTDYSAASLFIDSANPAQILTQGTAIHSAIQVAELSFEQDNNQHKALIIVSDGEDHDEVAEKTAKDAFQKGMLVMTVGVGTAEGGYIPVKHNVYNDYKRDAKGALVRSKLNEDMLKAVADAGGGNYYNIVSGEDAVLGALSDKIDRIEKQEFEERMFDEHESYFWIFLIPALLLLVIEFLISFRGRSIVPAKGIS